MTNTGLFDFIDQLSPFFLRDEESGRPKAVCARIIHGVGYRPVLNVALIGGL
jgi:hypothetical protein